MARKKRKNSIRQEIESLVRQRVDPMYLERIGGVVNTDCDGDVSVCRAIAMAQVKKGLEGDLRAAEFIEEILSEDAGDGTDSPFRLVLKVVGASGAGDGA